MRLPFLILLLVLALQQAAQAQMTELGANGKAQFTEEYQRQLVAEGFRPDGTGAFYRIVKPATAFTPIEVEWQSCEQRNRGDSLAAPSYPRNPNPEPVPIRPPPEDESDSDYPETPAAGQRGPQGPAGPRGPAGPQGPPGTVTDEQLAEIVSRVVAQLRADDSLRGPKGDKGDPGEPATIDLDALATSVEARMPSTGFTARTVITVRDQYHRAALQNATDEEGRPLVTAFDRDSRGREIAIIDVVDVPRGGILNLNHEPK